MNRAYRVIFNHATGVWQCVSELARSQGKTKSFKALSLAVMMAMGGEAMAVEYTDGQAHTLDVPILIDENLVSNAGTSLSTKEGRFLFVGIDGASGMLTISNGATVSAEGLSTSTSSSNDTQTVSDISVEGANSSLQINSDAAIGFNRGVALFKAINGATVNLNKNTGFTTIGSEKGGEAMVYVLGHNTSLNTKDLIIGRNGKGLVEVFGGSNVTTDLLIVGANTTGSGTLNITTEAEVHSKGVVIGGGGLATVEMNNGFISSSDDINFAEKATGNATVNLKGDSVIVTTTASAIGYDGNATINLSDESTYNSPVITVGLNQGSTGTINLTNQAKIFANDITIGANGTGIVNVNSGQIDAQGNIITAKGQGSTATINVTKVSDSVHPAFINSNQTIHVGYAGNATINIKDGSVDAEKVILGTTATGYGKITINQPNDKSELATLNAKSLVVGDAGKGELIIANQVTENGWYYTGMADNLIIANQSGSSGIFDIQNAIYQVKGNIVVGNQGNAVLKITNSGGVNANNIIRSNQATSTLLIDGGDIDIIGDQPNVFKGFDKSTPVQLGSKGITFGTDAEYYSTDQNGNRIGQFRPYKASIDPNAVIVGNVGKLDIDSRGYGGFIKSGFGKLTINNSSMQWRGDTVIAEGLMQINGDYVMQDGDRLGIALLDAEYTLANNDISWHDADGIIDPKTDDYPKFIFTDKLDISKGEFFVVTDDIIKNTDKSAVWKDVVSAGTLVGQFKQVSDNSLLVDFVADYSDANKVHLKLANENTTNNTNSTTNNTTNNTTGNTTGNATNNTNSSTNVTTGNTTNGTNSSTNVTTGNATNSTNNSTNVTTNGTTNSTTGNTTTGNTTNNTNSSTNVTTGNTTNSTNNSTNVTTGNATNGTNSSTNVTTNGTTGNTTTGNTTNSTNNSTNVTTNGTTNSTTGNTTTGNTTNNTNSSTNVTTGNTTNGTNSSTNVTTNGTTNSTTNSTNVTTNGTTGNTTNSTNNSTNVTTNSTTNNTNVTTNNVKFVTAVTNNDNHNSIALAQVLDTAVANKVNNVSQTSADATLVNSLLGEFTTTNGYDTDGAKMSQAVSSMQPLLTGSVNRALVHASLHAVDAIYDTRLDFEPIAQGSDTRQGTIWAKAIGADSSITGTKGALGYDQEDWGVVAGADTTLGNGKLGFALGYIDTQTDSTNTTQTADAKTTEAIIYGNYNATDDTAAYAHIGVARSDIKGERTIAVGSNPVAKSDYSADTIMAGLGVSHMIGSQAKYIAPFARLDYSHVSADAYQETGAGVYNLSVDKQSYESIRPTIGIKLGASVSDKLAVSATIAGAYENGDNQSVINASFDGTSLGFATLETDVGRAIGLAGVGVDYHFSPSTKLGVQYQGQWRDNYDSHGGMIKLSWQF